MLHRFLALFAVSCSLTTVLALPGAAEAVGQSFVVNSTADPGEGLCDQTECTLREAINAANANANGTDVDTISFAIPGGGIQTIAVKDSPLPSLSGYITVDGLTQPGAFCIPGNRTLTVEIRGDAVPDAAGLTATGPGVTIRGLVINRFGPTGYGIKLSNGTTVTCSNIGTNAAGTAALANGIGIYGESVGGFTIGGSTANGNVISGNTFDGIRLVSVSQGVLAGNRIGVSATGSALGNNSFGVSLLNTDGVTIGGADESARNLIAGNGASGVRISGISGHDNIIRGNYIGTADGSTERPNGLNGIEIIGAYQNDIAGNVISGNAANGVVVQDSTAASNEIIGNIIGLKASGSGNLANAANGVLIDNAPMTLVGGNTESDRNTISGNGSNGVYVNGPFTDGVRVSGNYIGLNSAGTAAQANQANGVFVTGGALASVVGNVISGNGVVSDDLTPVAGVRVTDRSWLGMGSNVIGLAADGATVRANRGFGVLIEDSGSNSIGGLDNGNTISGNSDGGIKIVGPLAQQNVISFNYIGTDATGVMAKPNSGPGIAVLDSSYNLISSNVTSGNQGPGILIEGATSVSNDVDLNIVGTVADRSAALPNAMGVDVVGATNTNVHRNIISGNTGDGLRIESGASRTTVYENRIGTTDELGTVSLGNTGNGVAIINSWGSSVVSAIAFNGGSGVTVVGETADQNVISSNIHSNNGRGIDLGANGIDSDDQLDADTGPNQGQNFPIVTMAVPGTLTVVDWSIHSKPLTKFTAAFYASPGCDSSGNGEGARWIGVSMVVTTDSSGNGIGTAVLSGATLPGEIITAVATDLDGNSSEFSPCREVSPVGGDNPPPTITTFWPHYLTRGQDTVISAAMGTGFIPGVTQLRWNGEPRETTVVTQFFLQATILASDLTVGNAPFYAQVTVSNPGPGGGTSAALLVLVRSRADANCSGPVAGNPSGVSPEDALHILRIIAGNAIPAPDCDPNADGIGGTTPTVADALYVLRVAAGLEPLP
ncbi:hypothetical protein AYO38_02205 [bacterium SCGC AG-212-C10]|nr:hypothetical protein AYO38_02205 [bacterium SCGC AG-212-C10]